MTEDELQAQAASPPRSRSSVRGNENCFVCKRLRVLPFRHCADCSLPGARDCPPIRASFLLVFGVVLTGLTAYFLGGPVGKTIFLMTSLIVAIILLVINSYSNEQARSRQRLAQLRQELAEQHEFLKDLSPLDTLDKCLDHIVTNAALRLRCRRVSVMMPDKTGTHLYIAAARGVPQDVIRTTRIPIGERISGRVFQSDKPLHVSRNHAQDDRPGALPIESEAFMSGPLMLSGMRWGHARLGVLSITEPYGRDDFSIDDEFVFSNICEASAVAIYNHMAVAKVKQGNVEFLETLVNAIEARDAYTRGHSERVCKYSLATGRAMRLDDETLSQLAIAGRLHDIGKIGMADAILLKRGEPSEAEWESIRRHPDIGAEMLVSASLVTSARDAIRCHHERLDGSGYPHGLKDEDIPLMARIIGVADAFDAMTTVRPYREAMSFPDALTELRRYAGRQFDAACVEAFLRAVEYGDLFASQSAEAEAALSPAQ